MGGASYISLAVAGDWLAMASSKKTKRGKSVAVLPSLDGKCVFRTAVGLHVKVRSYGCQPLSTCLDLSPVLCRGGAT